MNFCTSIYDFLFQAMLTAVRRIKKIINTALKKAIIKVFFIINFILQLSSLNSRILITA